MLRRSTINFAGTTLSWAAVGAVLTLISLLVACDGLVDRGPVISQTTPSQVTTPTGVGAASPRPVRIDAGARLPQVDNEGNPWLADTGFDAGELIDSGPVPISNTRIPAIYQTAHRGMRAFSYRVPDGPYTILLHFAETDPAVLHAGQRVFEVNVEGTPLGRIDVFAQSGGRNRALVRAANVIVHDARLQLTFTPVAGVPEISGIEVFPAEGG